MQSAEQFRHQPPGVLHKAFGKSAKEEVVLDNTLRDLESLLRLFKVKVTEQVLEEQSDRIRVLVFLHLDDPRKITDVVTRPGSRLCRCATGDDSGCYEVTEKVGARSLNRVEVRWAEPKLEQTLGTVLQVEEDEQRPVEKPRTGLQLTQRLGSGRRLRVVDHVAEVLDLLERRWELSRQDV